MRKLDRLVSDIRACRVCIESPRNKPLPHEPRPVLRVSRTARICIVGQAPGTRVHASGTPFTDPSGDRLRDWMGVTSEEFYDVSRIAIVPMGFCFPGLDAKGGDLPPRRECAERWRHDLFELLPQMELTLLVGQYAQAWHLGTTRKESLTATVSAWKEYYPRFLPLPHPSWRNNAWIKKNPWFEEDLLPVLKREVRRLIG
ncbi:MULTISPECIES: uracil-DNA glycosylase family protein [Pseudomonadota]|uniref:uracil-DNA glycosylase family protein n=1 Tax=Pseudomonadota TaxID=1224 RepID=UPI00272EEFEC|nr:MULTISPECIES: uracil-DNA glycosylase family protein [Pseudomonadota]MDP1627641.1 uracil-DNA glycosylase family protein [Parvibaculum sp.]MDP2243743.1 uracil-DNA glycosylase family protein [Pseudomonas sp.]MDP3329071.1 uracil-DNA glycosylase family protein [Parvibaculum sp.]